MSIEEFYYDLPFHIKENVGFAMNYSFLALEEREFVDRLYFGLHSDLSDDLISVKDDLGKIIDRFKN